MDITINLPYRQTFPSALPAGLPDYLKVHERFEAELRTQGLVTVDYNLVHELHNNAGRSNTYHNGDHCYNVAFIAYYLLTQTPESVKTWEVKSLLIAAMLHDLDHTGGREDDSVNITLAVSAVRDLKEKWNMGEIGVGLVTRLIECTEYPFKRDPETVIEKCLRDADILYGTLCYDASIIMEGLRRELEVTHKRHITYREMYEGQEKFYETVRLFTPEGRRLFAKHKHRALKLWKEYAEKWGWK